MTTNYHTPIPSTPPEALEATTTLFNSRFSDLDAGITEQATDIGDLALMGTTIKSNLAHALGYATLRTPQTNTLTSAVNSVYDLIDAAADPYASLKDRLDAMVSGYVGGNIATLTDGAATAGQKNVTVDDTTGFLVGGRVAYQLVGGALEYNVIASITPTTVLVMTTNIGTGGIADDSYIGLISVSEYLSAQAIPHAGELTLDKTITYTNAGRFNVQAYGASPSASESVNLAAFNATIAAVKAAGGGIIEIPAGTYAYNGALDLCDAANIALVGTGGHYLSILECHNTGKAAIEIIGSKQIKLENIKIVGDATDTPAVGIWTGRSTAEGGTDTSQIWFERVAVWGAFTVAAWYVTGCESNHFHGIQAYVDSAPCKAGIMFDWENTAGTGNTENALTPEHTTIHSLYVQALGAITNSFINCSGSSTAFSPIYIVNESGGIQVQNTYVTAYGRPIYYMLGAGVLEVLSDYVEGSPSYIIHGDYLAGKSNRFVVHLQGCSGPAASSGSAIFFDDATTVTNSLIERCNYIDDLRFYDILASKISQWCAYSSGDDPALVVTHLSSNCYFEIEYEDTYSNANPTNTIVVYNSNIYGGYTLLPGLAVNRNNVPGATGEAVIQRIIRASKSWAPGEIADGASAKTTVDLTGVLQADPFFCMAHYAGISGYAGWELSAVAGDSVVGVTIVNRSGGALTPTGTLSVVAWKITAA